MADTNSKHYTGEDIQVLEGLEAVRKRPGMYIGSTGPRGLHHLVYEVVDNAVDEALAGYCKNIDVTIHEDNSITVIDDGRGIPVDIHPKEGIPTVEVVLTILHAGGKFGGEGYKVSGGLHGVGVSVVNALSSKLSVEVSRDGKKYQMTCERGITTEKLHEVGTCEKSGTKVTFWPDPEVFTETTIYDYDILANRFREMAFLNKGLTIILHDERKAKVLDGASEEIDSTQDSDSENTEDSAKTEELKTIKDSPVIKNGIKTQVFYYEGGIIDYVEFLTKGKETLNKPIYFSAENEDGSVEIAMQ